MCRTTSVTVQKPVISIHNVLRFPYLDWALEQTLTRGWYGPTLATMCAESEVKWGNIQIIINHWPVNLAVGWLNNSELQLISPTLSVVFFEGHREFLFRLHSFKKRLNSTVVQ